MILIGGQALRELGHDRHTDDVDYLINDSSTSEVFIFDKEKNTDYINAANNEFFMQIYKMGQEDIASPQQLAELKAYALVQHCQNFNFQKADACEYDLKFLFNKFGVKAEIVSKYITEGEMSEIKKIYR